MLTNPHHVDVHFEKNDICVFFAKLNYEGENFLAWLTPTFHLSKKTKKSKNVFKNHEAAQSTTTNPCAELIS